MNDTKLTYPSPFWLQSNEKYILIHYERYNAAVCRSLRPGYAHTLNYIRSNKNANLIRSHFLYIHSAIMFLYVLRRFFIIRDLRQILSFLTCQLCRVVHDAGASFLFGSHNVTICEPIACDENLEYLRCSDAGKILKSIVTWNPKLLCVSFR